MSEAFPPPGSLLRIKDWDKHFERAQTRKVEGPLAWVAIPTKHDGLKISRLLAKQNGLFCLGAFILMVEVGAKTRPRGLLLASDGEPLTTRDLAGMTGARAADLDAALKVLISKEIGWIEVVSLSASSTSQLPLPSDMRKEEKRKEEKRKERPPSPPTGGNGLSSVFEAIGEACGWDLALVDGGNAQKANLLIEDLRSRYDDCSEQELGEMIRAFGRWYFEIEFEGHRATLNVLRTKWASFREYQIKNAEPVSKRSSIYTDEAQAGLKATGAKKYPDGFYRPY